MIRAVGYTYSDIPIVTDSESILVSAKIFVMNMSGSRHKGQHENARVTRALLASNPCSQSVVAIESIENSPAV
jgi:hypothetical protein